MMKGVPWKGVAAVASGRFTPFIASSVSSIKLRSFFGTQRKETVPLCACWRSRLLTKCRLCKVEPTTFISNKSRQQSLIRGIRVAAEAPVKLVTKEESESETESEGELADLPEDLETAAWSVGLDGLNVDDVPSNACVLGIDPDASGAIAVLRAASQEVLDVPCVKVQIGKTMRRRHDASSIVDLVNGINAPAGSVAYVEQAMPFPKDGKQGWYGCGFGYGMWVGILMALGFRVVPVRAQAWKSAMGISGRQYTKDDSRNLAMALFPDLGPQLKRKKDHGRADAILIAAFGKGLSPPPKPLDEETE